MNRFIVAAFLLFFWGLMLSACASVQKFEEKAAFVGRISDEKGLAVSEYRIFCNGRAALTGKNGIFVFPDISAGTVHLTGGKKGWSSIDEKITFLDRKKLVCLQVRPLEDVFQNIELLLEQKQTDSALVLLEKNEDSNKGIPLFEFYRSLIFWRGERSEKNKSIMKDLLKKASVSIPGEDLPYEK